MKDELPQIESSLREVGYAILPGVIPSWQCGEICESVSATVAREARNYATGRSAAENKVGFTPSLINHDQSFAEFLADDRLLAVVHRLFGHHPRISFTSAIINEPGNLPGSWHADWPFNQNNAGHVPAPYPDVVMHLTTLWMLTEFSQENGGTLIVPGSHRRPTNPTARHSCSGEEPLPDEIHVTGSAGSVLIMDSRLWHSTAPNHTDKPRVALAVRYAPWWLNLEVLRPESAERQRLLNGPITRENEVPSIQRDAFAQLPETVKPLYEHWLED